MSNPNLTSEHLAFIIPLQHGVNKLAQVSATKQKLHFKLKELGITCEDDDGYIQLTNKGQTVIDLTINQFNYEAYKK